MTIKFRQSLVALCLSGSMAITALAAVGETIDIGSRIELFVDHFLIDRLDGVQLVLHEPRPAEKVLEIDRPWEGEFNFALAVWKDGDRYRMFYRALPPNGHSSWCIAESADGIQWMKPNFGLVEWEGSRANNFIQPAAGQELIDFTGLSISMNNRPGAPESERYIGVVPERPSETEAKMFLWFSSDGVRWRKMQDEPVYVTSIFNAFDAYPPLYWSEAEQQYVLYHRYLIVGETYGADILPGVRSIARTTSPDLLHWSDPVPMVYGDDGPKPPENLYTNSTCPYFRAPHIWVAFPARFMPERRVITDEQRAELDMATFGPWRYDVDCADSAFMTTRGGNTYDRTFMNAFIRPGFGPANWVSRSNYALRGVVPTGPAEMSVYVNRHYTQATWHVQRLTLRLDGFASVRAPYEGGELLTKPLTFRGRHLVLNHSNSAAGHIRVEVQDPEGRPIPGFTLEDCYPIYGDNIERGVAWKSGADLGAWAGQPVRLRFVMKDADLYSLRFQEEAPPRVAYRRVDPVVLPADPLLDFSGGQMTVEAFVYVDPPSSELIQGRILSKYDHEFDDTRRGWEWVVAKDGRFQFRVNLHKPEAKGIQGDQTLKSRDPLPRQRWIHVATVFDRPNRRLRLYLDGRLEAERTIPNLPMRRTPDQDVVLGQYGSGRITSKFFGKLDELRLTAAALEFDSPPSEPYAGDEPATIGLYHFDKLADGASVPNAASKSPLQSRVHVPGEDRLGESMPAFGSALKMDIP